MIFEIIKSDHFLTVKEIANRASSNLPEVDRISPTTVWSFIRNQSFWVNCLLKNIFWQKLKNQLAKSFENKNIDRDWTNVIFTDETTFRVGKKKRRCWLMPNILNYTSIRKLSKKVNAWEPFQLKENLAYIYLLTVLQKKNTLKFWVRIF